MTTYTPEQAEASGYEQLTEAIGDKEEAYWRDGTRKGNVLELMLVAHPGSILVAASRGAQVWQPKPVQRKLNQ